MVNRPVQITNSLLSNAAATLGVAVPASTTYTLKEIHLYNSGAGVNRVRIRHVGTDADTFDIVDENMAAGATLNLPFNLVMVAAEYLKGYATTANEVHIVASAFSTV